MDAAEDFICFENGTKEHDYQLSRTLPDMLVS